MKFVVAAMVAIAALLVLGGGLAGYSLAGQAQANDAVRAVNRDVVRLNAAAATLEPVVKAPPAYPHFTGNSSPQDFIGQAQQFDAAADKALGQVAAAKKSVSVDHVILADAQRRLKSASGSWLTLLQRTKLQQGQRRVADEQQAVELAGQMVDAADRQVRSARSAIDGLAAYAALIDKLQGGDLNGSLAAYAGVHADFAQAVALAAGAHLPPVWDTLLNHLNTLADDTRDGILAIQKGDSAAAQAKASALDADSKALDDLDTSSLDQNMYLDDLLTKIKALEAKAR